MSSKREEIQAFVGQFVDELTKKMREAAMEGVELAFGDEPPPLAQRSRG